MNQLPLETRARVLSCLVEGVNRDGATLLTSVEQRKLENVLGDLEQATTVVAKFRETVDAMRKVKNES